MPLKLDDLPVEIIQRIASRGPCESALTLSRVNSSLHRACNDRQVFKAILRNRNGYGGSSWDAVPLSNDSPISSWARYALADSAARQWIFKDEGIHATLPPHFSLWAPQLMSSSHPLLNYADPAVLLLAFDNAVRDESYAPAFCFTLSFMSRSPRELRSPLPYEDGSTGWRAQGYLNINLYYGLAWSNGATRDVGACEKYRGKQFSRCVVALGIMSEMLRQNGYTHEQVMTPTATEIDFHAMMNMPPPFCPCTPAAMELYHLSTMTSQRFLEDGEWMGLYSCSLDGRRPTSWDPPMRGIHFTTRIDLNSPGQLFLKGSGTDRVGSFILEGCLFPESGVCTMSKEYRPGHRWFWDAFMTPFGIVGTWGKAEWGGWVWLWKASWLPRRV